jgi:hypothetical protein
MSAFVPLALDHSSPPPSLAAIADSFAMALLGNPFSTLGLPYGTSDNDVQRAYTALALRVHPDRPGGDTAAFQRVLAAKEALATETLRAAALVAQPPAAVELQNLTGRPELNGQVALVLRWGFGANARWTLQLQGQATQVSARACRCFPAATPPPAAPWAPQAAPWPPQAAQPPPPPAAPWPQGAGPAQGPQAPPGAAPPPTVQWLPLAQHSEAFQSHTGVACVWRRDHSENYLELVGLAGGHWTSNACAAGFWKWNPPPPGVAGAKPPAFLHASKRWGIPLW